MNTHIEQRDTEKKGKGTFARKRFRAGEAVYSISPGKLINRSELNTVDPEDADSIEKIDENTYEIMMPPARYINHSCNPNIQEVDRVGYALRDIELGEELTVDYELGEYFGVPFDCFCNAENCRKHIPSK